MSRTLNQNLERQYIGCLSGQCLRRLLVNRLRL
jgi:ribosomal protein L34E